MDIFNRKRVKELEEKLRDAEIERNRYKHEGAALTAKLDEITKLMDSTPADCVRGEWCRACEFVRTFMYHNCFGHGCYGTTTAYVCGKGKSCSNFVQKEE